MEPLKIEEIKKLELAILKSVSEYCDKCQIRYYLGGGTLLGAVRHKGFIPWDDDIDIMMPRPDYIRFIEGFNGYNHTYFVKSVENDSSYVYTMAKVYDNRTYLIDNTLRKSLPYAGVFIDIFPIDGLPCSEVRQKLFFKEQELLNVILHASGMKYRYSHRYVDSKDRFSHLKGFIRTILKFIAISIFAFLPAAKLAKYINNNSMKYDYEVSQFIGAIVDCRHGGASEKMPKKEFEKRILFDFENNKFWGTGIYDFYLSSLYGDYMTPPSKENCLPHHDFIAYWKNKE